jgi:hypothetical protein
MLKLFKDAFKIKLSPKEGVKEAATEEAKVEEVTVEEVKVDEVKVEEVKAEVKIRIVDQIAPNLFIYTSRIEEPFCVTFEIANILPLCLDFEIDFTGSENIQAFNDQDVLQDLHLIEKITPFSVKTLGCLKKADSLAKEKVEMKMFLDVIDENLEDTKAAAAEQMSRVAAEIAKQAADPNGDHDYFIDTMFPPCRYFSFTSDVTLICVKF